MIILLSGYGFVLNIAPPSLSRNRRIKKEQTNNAVPKVQIFLPCKAAFALVIITLLVNKG